MNDDDRAYCQDLAEHFLQDESTDIAAQAERVKSLTDAIQETVDAWLDVHPLSK